MEAIRKPRFSDCAVEKAMDGFFNNLLVSQTNDQSTLKITFFSL
jgi:hypothetical protein